jgi:hypothetical protein
MAALEDYKSELEQLRASFEQRQGGAATKAELDDFMHRISSLRNAGIKVNTDYASLISAMPAPG